MCNRFIEDFTNKVAEKAFKKTWLWIYKPDGFMEDTLDYLLIEANTRNEAMWKLKLAADPYIGDRNTAPMGDAYGLNFLFHADLFHGPFNNYNMNKATIENFVPAFEEQIRKTHGYELKEITEMNKI